MAVGDEVIKTASDAIHSGDAVRVQNLTSAAKWAVRSPIS